MLKKLIKIPKNPMLKNNFRCNEEFKQKQQRNENNKTKVHKSSGLSVRYFQRELKV